MADREPGGGPSRAELDQSRGDHVTMAALSLAVSPGAARAPGGMEIGQGEEEGSYDPAVGLLFLSKKKEQRK